MLGGGNANPGRGGNPGGFNLGEQLNKLMNNQGLQTLAGQVMEGVGETINGISRSFFAPKPTQNGIPPHVLRRGIIR